MEAGDQTAVAAPSDGEEAAAAAHWEAAAKRARAVSEQWRQLHADEEKRADEARAMTSSRSE